MQLSYSQLTQYRRCHKAWQYRYQMHLSPKVKDAKMAVGQSFHQALSLWYTLPVEERSRNALALYVNQAVNDSPMSGEQERNSRPVLRAMIDGFCQYFGQDDQIPQLIAGETSEARFTVPLSESIDFTGVVDGILHRGSEKWILEHKTGNPSLEYFGLLDEQGTLYAWALNAVGVIYTFITQPTSRGIAEVNRIFVERTEKEKRVARIDATATAWEITEGRSVIYRTRGQHCLWCAYKMLCVGYLNGASEEALIEEHYERSKHEKVVA